jgi:hypothetical protein
VYYSMYCSLCCHVPHRRGTLEKFLTAASSRPQDVLHYEFMQDYRVSEGVSDRVRSEDQE